LSTAASKAGLFSHTFGPEVWSPASLPAGHRAETSVSAFFDIASSVESTFAAS